REAAALVLRGVVLNFRSCSGELNRAPRLYHSGETSDLDWLIGRLLQREPSLRLGLVGVSLGGNVALKWLGERGEGAPAQVAGAVAISTPFDLAACAGVLDQGLCRSLYTAEYDRVVTAPLFGFSDERDYWTRSSSGRYLAGIRRPCLLINAMNDPFVPPSSLPTDAVARSSWLEALFPREGGHAGFLEGPLGRRSWAEHRTLAYLRGHLLGQKSALSGPRSIR